MKQGNDKLVIGITHSPHGNFIDYLVIKTMLRALGAQTRLLTIENPGYGSAIDGLILSGGADIHPAHYNFPAKPNYRYSLKRDEMEFAWLKTADARNLPVLGICRGGQLINVYRGGTLHPDVSKVYEKAKYPSSLLAKIFYRKGMNTVKGTLMSKIIGRAKVRVNSIHTQSIADLGENLRVSAYENNKVVQAIEDPRRAFFIGLQFHPEFLLYSPLHRNIFKAFVAAAVANAKPTHLA